MLIVVRMRYLILLALLASCTTSRLRTANRAALVSSMGLLACDWGQTRSAASTGWAGLEERNPVMGTNPSTGHVDVYFASVAAVNVALYLLMPERARWVAPSVVSAVQVNAIAGNTSTVPGPACGL